VSSNVNGLRWQWHDVRSFHLHALGWYFSQRAASRSKSAHLAVISDELNHASIIDGIRLCRDKRFRYRNNDMLDLEAQLQLADAAAARFKLIATDGVFSMDSIIANLQGKVARRRGQFPDHEVFK
jgi:hypothetical protein